MRRMATWVGALAIAVAVIPVGAQAASVTRDTLRRPVNPATGLPVGVLPTRQAAPRIHASSPSTLTYRGGPVVSDAQVETVLWGSGGFLSAISAAGGFDTWFTQVLTSPYLAWLTEYNTPSSGGTGQQIGFGSYLGLSQITPSASGTTVDDSQIQSELIAQVNAGHLPAPTADASGYSNTVYAVFFPPGVAVTLQGSQSGVDFCAYHGETTTSVDGQYLRYLVLPDDQNTAYRGGCGNSTDVNNLESYTSHELVEAITDPDVRSGGAQGWYNDSQGEIGDICNGQTGTVTGPDSNSYWVQKEWSNGSNACIVNKAAVAPPAPSGLTATAVAGGKVHLSWTPPTSDGGSAITGYDVYRSASPDTQGSLATEAPPGSTYDDQTPADDTYYYTVTAVNAVGQSPGTQQASATSDGTAPKLTITAPSTLLAATKTLKTAYSATDAGSGVASYDVRWRNAKWNAGFSTFVLPPTWQHVSVQHETLTGNPGYEYCFSARARDSLGNVSSWSHEDCQVVPLDDRSLSAATSGWSRTTSSSAYLGTVTQTKTRGSALKLTGVQVRRLALVITTCPSCGHVGVYAGSTLLASVNTSSTTTHYKVLHAITLSTLRTTTLVLRATDANARVIIDGLAVSRT